MEYLDTQAGMAGCSKQVMYPVPAELEVGEGQQLAWPSSLQTLLDLTSLSAPHIKLDMPPREAAGHSSRAVTSRPHRNAADTPNPHAKSATPAPSQSPHEQRAAPGTAQRCPQCRRMSLAVSQVKEDLPHSVPDTRCIVHENTWGSPRRTDSLAALGFLPPGPAAA